VDRIAEPELMDDPRQAMAYARADFSEPHNHFVDLFLERFGNRVSGTVLDLGCGPGDICRRFARACPHAHVLGVDGAQAMLELGRTETREQGLEERVELLFGYLPDADLPLHHFHTLISNSLLHHLKDPAVLWQSIKKFGAPQAVVFVMDLLRPANRQQAEQLVSEYAATEPEVLQTDFFNSLLAAYRIPEIRRQLQQHGLDHLQAEVVSDRHFIVSGRL